MASVLVLDYDDERLIEDYLSTMRAGGAQTGRSTTQAALSCQAKIRRVGGWHALGAAEQADAVLKARSYTSWLMATGRITVEAELLSRTDLRPGIPARRLCPEEYHWFSETCSRIGVSSTDTTAQWNLLVKITAITGVAPRALTDTSFDTGRAELTAAYTRRGRPSAGRNVAAALHRLRVTLFHAGQLTSLRPPAVKKPVSVTGWATVTKEFAVTARRYVEQVTLSLRPSTVCAIDRDLRQFGTWLADTHPEV